jgi:glycosyltransferase involved in cell wall biosynthesis
MKRAVYEVIGGLDERFGLGFFDDDDLAVRARQAGFELAVAHDLLVHHYVSRTFQGNGIDVEKLLEENGQRFAEKWGNAAAGGQRVTLQPWNGNTMPGPQMTQMGADEKSETGEATESRRRSINLQSYTAYFHLRSSAKSADKRLRARVSLTMIVRNEEGNLEYCLGSVAGLFDEIVVVDTGSTDRTIEIAREFGARVFDFVWVDDFAAARNAALARATGDYAFWLDADDVIDSPEREKLRALLDELRPCDGIANSGPHSGPYECAYVIRCSCDPGPNGDGGQTVVVHIRLFPLREDVRWSYRVHEQILPALRRANVTVRWTDITVRHTGYTDPALRERKLQRDSKILEEDLAERPDDPFVLFNLGSIAMERKDWKAALNHLNRSLAGSAPTDSVTRKLFAFIARAHQMRGDFTAALQVCADGLRLDPNDAELLFRQAVLYRSSGHPAEAEACWRRILRVKRPDQFSSVDQGIPGHLTLRNLAVLAAERRDHGEARGLWQRVLNECPQDPEAIANLSRLPVADLE